MILKIINLFKTLLILSLSGCSSIHYVKGIEYQNKGQFEKAIKEYKKGLSTNNNASLFSIYNNLGNSYEFLGKMENAKKSYLEAAAQWPARAYYPYLNLASLNYRQGKLLEAIQYSQKAKILVQSPVYQEFERNTAYGVIDTVKKRVFAQDDYLQLALSFTELKKQFERKKYQDVQHLADLIINKKYHVDLGMGTAGNIVQSITRGSISDLNGIIKGDEILEIEGKKITDAILLINTISNMSDRFGEKVDIKVRRNKREFTVVCYLYYPELETARQMRSEATKLLATGKVNDFSKDLDPPQILVLKPEIKRGVRAVSEKNIELVILAGDNFQVKNVSVGGTLFNISEANYLEKNLLSGRVKKYKANLPISDGETTFLIKAIDVSGNQATKEISITYDPLSNKQPEIIYQHNIAVVIGINKYHTWPSLEFGVSDAKAIKEKLYTLGFDQVIELYDNEASRLQILRLLSDKLPNLLGENDNLMIYFAGHGQTSTIEYKDKQGQIIKEKEGYIIPIDADTTNYEGTAIAMSKIREMSKTYKAKHILYVFDSCYSGLGLKRSGGIKKGDDYIKKLSSMKAVQILTAGGENEEVGEEKGHGIFTRYFLLALEGKADIDNDGFITASEIGIYIRPTVSRKTDNLQTPRFGWLLGEGDFIFENPG